MRVGAGLLALREGPAKAAFERYIRRVPPKSAPKLEETVNEARELKEALSETNSQEDPFTKARLARARLRAGALGKARVAVRSAVGEQEAKSVISELEAIDSALRAIERGTKEGSDSFVSAKEAVNRLEEKLRSLQQQSQQESTTVPEGQ